MCDRQKDRRTDRWTDIIISYAALLEIAIRFQRVASLYSFIKADTQSSNANSDYTVVFSASNITSNYIEGKTVLSICSWVL